MKAQHLVVLAAAIASTSLSASPAIACYCDSVPFPKAAASADVVVIGRVLDRVTKENDPAKRTTWGDRYWTSRVQIERVVKGKRIEPFVVGGFWSSCDGGSAAEVGHTYAFAFQDKVKLSLGFYWMTLCSESSAEIRHAGLKGGVTPEQVVAWAGGKDLPSPPVQPHSKQMQRTRPAQAMEPRR